MFLIPDELLCHIITFILRPPSAKKYSAWIGECPHDKELQVNTNNVFYDRGRTLLYQCIKTDILTHTSEHGLLYTSITAVDTACGKKNGHWTNTFELNTKLIQGNVCFFQYGAVSDDEVTVIGGYTDHPGQMNVRAMFDSFFLTCKAILDIWRRSLPLILENGNCKFESVITIVDRVSDMETYIGMGPTWLVFVPQLTTLKRNTIAPSELLAAVDREIAHELAGD